MAHTIRDFYRGDTKSFQVSLATTAYNGGICWFTLKNNKDDTDEEAVLQIQENIVVDPNDATRGLASFLLNPEDTVDFEPKNYNYDIQIVNSDKTLVTTVLMGVIRIMKEITRSY